MSCGASCSTTDGAPTPRRSTRRRDPGPGRTSSSCRTDATDTDCKPLHIVTHSSAIASLLMLPCRICPSIQNFRHHIHHRCKYANWSVTTTYSFRGVRIIREGSDYYLIYQGEIQRFLGSRQDTDCDGKNAPGQNAEEEQWQVSDRILFFLGDLEAACADAKRVKA
uniref:Uncharacterized protein n=1 Tax=Arundo donax TaxID=35708 RepID=A0A0A9E855_ARUDO